MVRAPPNVGIFLAQHHLIAHAAAFDQRGFDDLPWLQVPQAGHLHLPAGG